MSKYPGRIVTDLAPAGYSVFFDGSGDFLNVANNAALQWGTGDFCFETWVYLTAIPSTFADLICKGTNNAGTFEVTITSAGKVGLYTTTAVFNSVAVLATNQWYHIAITRSGTTLRCFINGALDTTVSSFSTDFNNTGTVYIGTFGNGSGNNLTGYLSNHRCVKGSPVYTAAFTPPTQLFNIPNTSLLTCNSPAIIDQSNNAFAITANGNAAVSTLTPFTAYVPYNPALGASTPGVWTLDEALQAKGTRRWNMYDPSFNLTTLLLHGNGTNTAQNNTFLDSSSNNFTITRNPASGPNAPTQGSFSPFSLQSGQWSNYFNGVSTNYLSLASSADFAVGTTFTFECWIYPTVSPPAGGQNIFGNTASGQFSVGYNGSTAWGIAALGTAWRLTTSTMPTVNAWNHIVVARSGTGTNQTSLFLNGVRVANGTVTDAFTTSGAANIGMLSSLAFTGYISNLRLVKGTDVYGTGNVSLTVPTAPITPITNTVLLTCQSNCFIDTNTQVTAKTITVNGTPSVQSFSPFYPTAAYTPATVGGSGYFDGAGDFLSYATGGSAAFNLSTGDWTIEAWIYRNASGAGHQIINLFNSAGANSGLSFYVNSSNQLAQDNGVTATTAAGTVPANAWTHVAAVRSSGNTQLYVNGVAVGSAITQAPNTAQFFRIGITANDILPCNGYISGLRIIKGQALNSSGNFTPPTAPVTTTAVGWTGANVASSITGTVSLLTNFTNAGIVDSTAKNVVETVGNAQISTTQSKFGGTSMSFDGTGDILQIPKRPYFDFPGDFTIEFWLYVNSLASYSFLMDTRSSVSTFWLIDLTTAGVIGWGPDATIRISSSAITTGQWYHVAISRSGASTRMFLNGTQTGSTYTSSALITAGTTSVVIGGSTSNTFNANVYMDDIRITTGIARYTANFTPQTSQWQDE